MVAVYIRPKTYIINSTRLQLISSCNRCTFTLYLSRRKHAINMHSHVGIRVIGQWLHCIKVRPQHMYESCYFTWISLFLCLIMNIPILYNLYTQLGIYIICSRRWCSCVQYVNLYIFNQKIKISNFEIKISKITRKPMKITTPPPPGHITYGNPSHSF